MLKGFSLFTHLMLHFQTFVILFQSMGQKVRVQLKLKYITFNFLFPARFARLQKRFKKQKKILPPTLLKSHQNPPTLIMLHFSGQYCHSFFIAHDLEMLDYQLVDLFSIVHIYYIQKMGIQLLLRLLKETLPERHLSAFRGQKAAIDGLSWVYRACYPAALQILQDTPTREHLDVFFCYLAMLKHYQIQPIVVFDGRILPHKKVTLQNRDATRQKNIDLAKEHAKKGERLTARKYAQRGIKITRKIIDSIFAALKENDIKFIVAPYESDAQIAWLVKQKHAHFAISQDSDLIAYHVPKVMFKLTLKGRGQFFDLQEMLAQSHKNNKHVGMLFALPQKQRIYCCILAGCDYFTSLRGVGLKTVLNKMIGKPCIENLILTLQQSKDAPPELSKIIEQVYIIFRHHWVYNTSTREPAHLNSLDTDKEKYEASLGTIDWYTVSVAQGLIDPFNLKPLQLQKYQGYKPPPFKSMILDLQHEQHRWKLSQLPIQQQPQQNLFTQMNHQRSPMKKLVDRIQMIRDVQDFQKCLNDLQEERGQLFS